MSLWRPLGDTLIELTGALFATDELTITEIDIDLPLEISIGVQNGRPVLLGIVPHSRWEGGFLPPVHNSRFSFSLVDEDGGGVS